MRVRFKYGQAFLVRKVNASPSAAALVEVGNRPTLAGRSKTQPMTLMLSTLRCGALVSPPIWVS